MDDVDQFLVKSTEAHLDSIQLVLSRICNIRLTWALYLEYASVNNDSNHPRVLKGWAIRNVDEEEERQEEEERRKKWLQIQFTERLGISPDQFWEAFAECSGKFQKTAKLLTSSMKLDAELGGPKVKIRTTHLHGNTEIYTNKAVLLIRKVFLSGDGEF